MTTYKVQASVCSVVVSTDTDDDRLKAYLYDHTTVGADDTHTIKGLRYAVITTTVVDFVTEQDLRDARSTGSHVLDRLIHEAERLARYQCGRLNSGCFSVVAAIGDYDNAQEKIGELAYG